MLIRRFSVGRHKIFSSFEHVTSVAGTSKNGDFRAMERKFDALVIGRWHNAHLIYPWPSKKDIITKGMLST